MVNIVDVNIANIRKDFPILKRKIRGHDLVYLDNAASTLKPNCVIQAINNHYSFESSNIHRGVHFLSEHGTYKYEQTRETLQRFINAKNIHEIIFTKGTTDAINLVANSYAGAFLNPGDQILISRMEHHSNIVPWQLIAEKKKLEIIEVPIDNNGDIIIDSYKNLLNEKVKLVAITSISNTLGTINPLKTIIEHCQEHKEKT